MPTLTIMAGDTARAIPFSPGVSVREVLEGDGSLLRTGCRGDGACGLCLVQIEAGNVGPPTPNERLSLAPEQLAQNFRLACQLMPEDDLHLRIINMVPKSNWRDLDPEYLLCTPSVLPPLAGKAPADKASALAVDLGTTQISLSLWDLKCGQRLYGCVGRNPQSHFGADIVTRLMAAGEAPENARRLACMPLEAVAEALQEMCSKDSVRPQEVTQVAIVGNTAMLALLTGADSRPLLQPQNWTRPMEYGVEEPQTWRGVLGIDAQANVEVISPLAGFVGSDLLAGVVATHLTKERGSLLIDFGTNSEMALWDGHTLWVTSAAGGPAFEGCGTQCGMPAEPGAIYRFELPQNSDGLRFQVLGEGQAKGFCGSGLVDLIACLCVGGELRPTGVFANPRHSDGYVVLQTDPVIRLSKRDVDTFQRAKAAIGAGISTLLARAQLSATELSRICVGGAFGRNLNVRNAQRLGLLPDVPSGRIELCGNTALAGCERLLLSPARTAELESLRKQAVIINLSQVPDFDTLFLENLYLQPLKMEQP